MNWIPLLGLLVAPLHAQIQAPPPVNRGGQVRVWRAWPSNYWEEGTVVSLSADTLVMERVGYRSLMALPLEALEKLEVRRGRGSIGRHWEPVPAANTALAAETKPAMDHETGTNTTQMRMTVPGMRLRVKVPVLSSASIVGTVLSLEADTLMLNQQISPWRSTPLATPFAAIVRVEVKEESTGRWEVLLESKPNQVEGIVPIEASVRAKIDSLGSTMGSVQARLVESRESLWVEPFRIRPEDICSLSVCLALLGS